MMSSDSCSENSPEVELFIREWNIEFRELSANAPELSESCLGTHKANCWTKYNYTMLRAVLPEIPPLPLRCPGSFAWRRGNAVRFFAGFFLEGLPPFFAEFCVS